MKLFGAERKVNTVRKCSIDHDQKKYSQICFGKFPAGGSVSIFFHYIRFQGMQTFEEKFLFSLFSVKTVL